MTHDPLSEQITIIYQGEAVKVHVDHKGNDRRFVVFLPGEEGNIILHMASDKHGNESWYENDQSTTRANELGELIEADGHDRSK